MITITKKHITNSSNRPFRNLISTKGIIIHWTANSGTNANAMAHYNYFQNHDVGASAHFFVDSNQIIEIIPDNEEAYHVGSRYSSGYTDLANTIRGTHYTPNAFLIGVEMCVNPESDWDLTQKNTIDLVNHLMQKHGLNANQVWRHYDITLKDCPKMMTNEEDEAWGRFKQILTSGNFPDESKKIGLGTVNSQDLNVRMGNGTFFKKVGQLALNSQVDIYESVGTWYRIGKGQWVSKSYITSQPLPSNSTTNAAALTGKVTADKLNGRSGPSTYFDVVKQFLKDEVLSIFQQEGDWYHVGNNVWVHKNYVDLVENTPYKNGIVTATQLNIRGGAGTNQPIVGSLNKGDEVKIFEERNGWYRIDTDQWVYALYVIEKVIKSGRINTTVLNVRQGPGTQFQIVGQVHQNDRVSIIAQEGDWYNIDTDKWVHSGYVLLENV
ncbi:MAG: SH3 domain-containing protein [Flavobacteriales bacterium]|nr:SH3 domain-containing protein [Flavobacteriales bacterium]